MIRKISAHYLFPIDSPPLKFGIVTCNATGEIIEVIDTGGVFREIASLEFYNGILVPGFVKQLNHTDQDILDKLKTLFWADHNLTIDGAFKKELFCGNLEPGAVPGINLISPVDLMSMRLIPESKIRILLPNS